MDRNGKTYLIVNWSLKYVCLHLSFYDPKQSMMLERQHHAHKSRIHLMNFQLILIQ